MQRYHEAGVTLTELAVVIAIIGLMLASIVGGANLLNAARVKKLISEYKNTINAISNFKEKYGYLPGDFDNASSYLSGASNGDGDTVIEGALTTQGTPEEDLIAWQQLALGEYIRGSYTGTSYSSAARYKIGSNAYVSDAYSTGVYYLSRAQTAYYGSTGTVLELGNIMDYSGTQKGLPFGGVVSARDAYAVDKKIDDGNPAKGLFYTVRRYPVTGSGENAASISTCVTQGQTADPLSTPVYYKLDDTSKECHLVYWYDKD